MPWEFSKASYIGGREEQQDRVALLQDTDNGAYCAVLADGMGGHQGGAMAAQTLIDCSEQSWPADTEAKKWLQKLCQTTHETIQQQGKANHINPRTTAVILLIQQKMIHWTHVGDSRLYHIRGERIVTQSHDHSVVQMLVALGKIKAEEMAEHPDQNRLTKSLGGNEALTIETHSEKIKHKDALILCSDGLWETILPDELISTTKQPNLQQAVQQIVEKAAERGGENGDNISLCIARYQASSLWEKLWG